MALTKKQLKLVGEILKLDAIINEPMRPNQYCRVIDDSKKFKQADLGVELARALLDDEN